MNFIKWLESVETMSSTDIASKLPKMSFRQQAQTDKDLHDLAINRGTFKGKDADFLIKDKEIKDKFQKIIQIFKNGNWPDYNEIIECIKGIKEDIKIHQRYLDLPFNDRTGQRWWHETWITTYNKWLSYLEKLKQSHPNQV